MHTDIIYRNLNNYVVPVLYRRFATTDVGNRFSKYTVVLQKDLDIPQHSSTIQERRDKKTVHILKINFPRP